jgi:multiple sugar transport system substrate-binding protein
MSAIRRRRFLKASSATLALSMVNAPLQMRAAHAASSRWEPERGANLRILRFKRFVAGDEEQFMLNTARFSKATGVEVKVDNENWEDLRPKAAVAANVGAGPDIVIGTDEDPLQYPSQLVDLSDLATYLGEKYGGWYDVCREYGMQEGKWIALPIAASGGAMVYRKSRVNAAGFDQFPKDTTGFLKLCRALKEKGTPVGFALGHATGDSNAWWFQILWAYGGRLADESGKVAINSAETVAALEYAKELYQTFTPGTASWLDPSNNKAFLSGEISVTHNGISIYYVAKISEDPRLKQMTSDIQHAFAPIGPIGKVARAGLMFPAFVFKYTKYPNAAKEYLRFMMEKEQFEPWQTASIGYISHTLKAYEASPVWKADPQHVFFRDVAKTMRHFGYAGKLGKASASAMADFVVVDMFAEVCVGQQTAKEAAQRAEKRAMRYYRT